MPDSSYLRTRSISKRVGGVVVTVVETGETVTVTLTKGDALIEVFADSVADIARAAKEMLAILENDR